MSTTYSPNAHGSRTEDVAPLSVKAKFRLFRQSTVFYPLVGLIVVSLVMVFASDSFLSYSNLSNIARQISVIGIIAVGMTFAILTGGIDLSVGAVMALSGTVAAGLMVKGVDAPFALLVGVSIALVFGMCNGALVAFARMPPIIVTLATMGIARGLALMYTSGYPINGLPAWVKFFGSGSVFGVQAPIIIMLVVYLFAWVLLERTAFGRYVYAIGGNEQAARLSGVRVSVYKMLVYTVGGLTVGIAGIVITSRLMSGQPNAGVGFEMDAIAAVVMGGTSIAGGRGSVIGTLLGALLLGVLNNGLNMMGMDPYVQNVIKGGIILLAIYIGRERGKY